MIYIFVLQKNKTLKSTCLNTYKNLFNKNISFNQSQTHLYTDASFMEDRAGMAIIHEDKQIQWKLSNKCFIYTAETLAILKAMENIDSEINHIYITIHNDSLSTSLLNLHNPTDIARKIQNVQYRQHSYPVKTLPIYGFPDTVTLRATNVQTWPPNRYTYRPML